MRSIIVTPDKHFPNQDQKSIDAVLKYVSDTGPHSAYIDLGDLGSFDQISTHSKDSLIAQTASSLHKDYRRMETHLKDVISVVGSKCKCYYIEGNHELRVSK